MTYLKVSASAFSSRTYNIIILCLTSYILVDFVLHHWGPPLQLADGAGAVQTWGADEIDPICESALGHLKVGPQLPAANAWKQMSRSRLLRPPLAVIGSSLPQLHQFNSIADMSRLDHK